MTLDIDQIKADRKAGTLGPWFHHDFSGAHDGEPIVQDACVSCTHPDHLTVCSMGGADFGWAGEDCLEKANTNARRIARLPDLEAAYIREREAAQELAEEAMFFENAVRSGAPYTADRLLDALANYLKAVEGE